VAGGSCAGEGVVEVVDLEHDPSAGAAIEGEPLLAEPRPCRGRWELAIGPSPSTASPRRRLA
jgi:hypothetical protein